jgi:hypothetical protein
LVGDGQVTNRPVYVAVGVSVNGERDILGLRAGDGGEGAKFWLSVLTEIKNRGVEDVCITVCDGLKGPPEATTTAWELAVGPDLHRAPDPEHHELQQLASTHQGRLRPLRRLQLVGSVPFDQPRVRQGGDGPVSPLVIQISNHIGQLGAEHYLRVGRPRVVVGEGCHRSPPVRSAQPRTSGHSDFLTLRLPESVGRDRFRCNRCPLRPIHAIAGG